MLPAVPVVVCVPVWLSANPYDFGLMALPQRVSNWLGFFVINDIWAADVNIWTCDVDIF